MKSTGWIGLNWTKVGLKAGIIAGLEAAMAGLNWTKVGLKAAILASRP